MPQATKKLFIRGKCGSGSGLGPFMRTIDLEQGYAYTATLTGKGYSSSSKGYPSHATTQIVAQGRHIVVLAYLSSCYGGKPYDVWFEISYSYGDWPSDQAARVDRAPSEADETPADVRARSITMRDFEFSVPVGPQGGRLLHEVQDVGLDLLGCEVVSTRGPSGLCFQAELLGTRGIRCTADWAGDPSMSGQAEAAISMRLYAAQVDTSGNPSG